MKITAIKARVFILALSILLNLFFMLVLYFKFYNHWLEPGFKKGLFRQGLFNELPKENNKIYFVGDSHTEAFELNELLHNGDVRNRGVWGDVSKHLPERLYNIIYSKPQKIFIMIGVNDIYDGIALNEIAGNVENIIEAITTATPGTQIFIESVLPANIKIPHSKENAVENIKLLNILYQNICKKKGAIFLDFFPYFIEGGKLKNEYSFDGLHLNGKGYVLLASLLKPYAD